MERNKFLKMCLAGGVAIAISPELILNKPKWEKTRTSFPIEKDDVKHYDVGLFYLGLELNYLGYKRMPCDLRIKFDPIENKCSLEFENIVFPMTPRGGSVKCDHVIFFDYSSPTFTDIIHITGEWEVYHGLITVCQG